MNELREICQLYQPVQPTVTASDEGLVYQEFSPAKSIEHVVYCFWQLKTHEPLAQDYNYQVVSDGCVDIFFDYEQVAENYIMGFCKKYTVFSLGKTFNYIGIRFFPAAFTQLFGVDAKQLSDQSQKLKNVLPVFAAWLESRLEQGEPFETVVDKLNQGIKVYAIKPALPYDARFWESLRLIYQKYGYLDVEKDLCTGLSPRQLRRIFNFYIGTTAKSFCNVVRFQYVLSRASDLERLKGNKLYYEVGFFDQAHFIKNFKQFYGITPGQAFR